jgi:hypothetical protein
MDLTLTLQKLLDYQYEIIEKYNILYGSPNEFYVDNHFEKLGQFKALLTLSTEELIELTTLNVAHPATDEFVAEIKNCILDMKELRFDHELDDKELNTITIGKNQAIPLEMKGMNAKKRTEIQKLSKLLDSFGTKKVIDFGSGKGYISQFLNNYDVINLESKRDRIQHYENSNRIKSICVNVSQDFEIDTLIESWQEFFNLNQNVLDKEELIEFLSKHDCRGSKNSEPVMICGLHCCGDLSVTMLRFFAKSGINILVNIGCCYNLLTECKDSQSTNGHQQYGFPVSNHLNSRQVYLGRTRRMMATQVTERWGLDVAKCKQNFIKHHWRCMLQPLLLPDTKLGKLSRTCFQKDFQYYCEFQRKKHCLNISNDDITRVYDKYNARLKEVEVYWTLRGMIGKVLENFILTDRVLFLVEQGYTVKLVSVFEKQESPRNTAIIAQK